MPIQGDQRAFSPRSKWEGFKTTRRKKNGQPVQQAEEFEHVRWYLHHEDGHVITCQPQAWMDTGGFAMYIQTVLAPWWQKKQTSWTGPDEFPAKRMLLVCDNASVHKADELKKLMNQLVGNHSQVPPAQHDAMAADSGPSCVWTHQNSAACAPRAAIGSEFATMEAGARTYRR